VFAGARARYVSHGVSARIMPIAVPSGKGRAKK
jgi:hypothetical protein